MTKENKALTVGDIVFGTQVHERAFSWETTKGLYSSVHNRLLKSNYRAACSIRQNFNYFQFYILAAYMALPLTQHLSILLDINALNELLEVGPDLRGQALANLPERIEVTSWSFRRRISFKTDRGYCAEFFAEAALTSLRIIYHRWKLDMLEL